MDPEIKLDFFEKKHRFRISKGIAEHKIINPKFDDSQGLMLNAGNMLYTIDIVIIAVNKNCIPLFSHSAVLRIFFHLFIM
jgi:hypothetical protein